MKKIHIIAVLILATLMLASCSRKPKNLIKDEAMTALLTDAYLLEGFYAVERGMDSVITDPVIIATYDSLFSKHGVTREQFDESMAYYMRHSDKYAAIHKKVVENLDKKVQEL